MTFSELAASRYSVRKYQDRPVESEKLSVILEAARVAPTAHNNQPQRIFAAVSPASREKLATVCKCTFGAPVILVVCYDSEEAWHNKLMPGYQSGETDAAICCTHMMLQAWDLGIASCWVGMFNSDQVKDVLGLPENLTVSALLPLGYAAEDAGPIAMHDASRDISELSSIL
jgi:nitroreductase